jgi:hypothetical protein
LVGDVLWALRDLSAAFKERYVDGIALEPHVDRLTEAQRLGRLERPLTSEAAAIVDFATPGRV